MAKSVTAPFGAACSLLEWLQQKKICNWKWFTDNSEQRYIIYNMQLCILIEYWMNCKRPDVGYFDFSDRKLLSISIDRNFAIFVNNLIEKKNVYKTKTKWK